MINIARKMGRRRYWQTYFGALRREGNVGFRRRRGEECVPVVRRTHFLSLQSGWGDEEKQ